MSEKKKLLDKDHSVSRGVKNTEKDMPEFPEMTEGLAMRKEREEMIKKGVVFPKTSELTYIDANGNVAKM